MTEQHCDKCGVSSAAAPYCWEQRHGLTLCHACAGLEDIEPVVLEAPECVGMSVQEYEKLRAVYEAAKAHLTNYPWPLDCIEIRMLAAAVRAVEE